MAGVSRAECPHRSRPPLCLCPSPSYHHLGTCLPRGSYEDSQTPPQGGCSSHSSVSTTHASSVTATLSPPAPRERARGAAGAAGTHLLLVRVDQLLVVPVPQLPGGLGRGQGGVEDEQLPGAVGGLQRSRRPHFRDQQVLSRHCGRQRASQQPASRAGPAPSGTWARGVEK